MNTGKPMHIRMEESEQSVEDAHRRLNEASSIIDDLMGRLQTIEHSLGLGTSGAGAVATLNEAMIEKSSEGAPPKPRAF